MIDPNHLIFHLKSGIPWVKIRNPLIYNIKSLALLITCKEVVIKRLMRDAGWTNFGATSMKGKTEMGKGYRKSPPDAFRTRVTEYALLTVLASLALFAGLAFLRFGSG
ncbi:MAG: hypothetical protein NTW80_02440 [Deltaproteobacteria bacterium]|nr:hypothetical protein [Deltaproteobacteria bacterium]